MIPLSELEYQYYLLAQKQKTVGSSSALQTAYQPEALKQELERTAHLYADLKQLYNNSDIYVYDDQPIPSGSVEEVTQGGWRKGAGCLKPVNSSIFALTLISVSSHKAHFQEVSLSIHFSNQTIQPWDDLLDITSSRGYYIHPEGITADTTISFSVRYKTNGVEREINFTSNSDQLLILKNQDPPPSAQSLYPTSPIDKIKPYLNKQYLSLSPHQALLAIDLSPHHYERDWQDIILLATFINQEPEKARLLPIVLPRLNTLSSSNSQPTNKFCATWKLGKGAICPTSLFKCEIQLLYASYRLHNKQAAITLQLEFGDELYALNSNNLNTVDADITTIDSTKLFLLDGRYSAHTPIRFKVALWEHRSTIGYVLYQERHSQKHPLFFYILRDQDMPPTQLGYIRPELRQYIKEGKITLNKNQALCLVDLKPVESFRHDFQDVIFLINLINLDYTATDQIKSPERVTISSETDIDISFVLLKAVLLKQSLSFETKIVCRSSLITYITYSTTIDPLDSIQPQVVISDGIDLFVQLDADTIIEFIYSLSGDTNYQVNVAERIIIQYEIKSPVITSADLKDNVRIDIDLLITSSLSVQDSISITFIFYILAFIESTLTVSDLLSIGTSIVISQVHIVKCSGRINIIEKVRNYEPDMFVEDLEEPRSSDPRPVDQELDEELTIDHLEVLLPDVKEELADIEKVITLYKPQEVIRQCSIEKKLEKEYGRFYTVEQDGREVTLTTQWLFTYQKSTLLPGQTIKLYSGNSTAAKYISNAIITVVSEDKTLVLVRSLSHKKVDYGELYSWWGDDSKVASSKWLDVTPLRRAVSTSTEARLEVEVQSKGMIGSLEWKLYYRESTDREIGRLVARGLDREKPGYCVISKAGARFGRGIYIIKISVKIAPTKTLTTFYKSWVVEEQTELLAASRYELSRYEQ